MRSSTVLLFFFALVCISQGTIYFFNGAQDSTTNVPPIEKTPNGIPSEWATQMVDAQLTAIKNAYAMKDFTMLHQLIEYSPYIQLQVKDFNVISYIGDCFHQPNDSIVGQLIANRAVGEVYDILMTKSVTSPTGYSIAYLMRTREQ